MSAFVTNLFAFPVLMELWRRFKLFRESRSERLLTVLSIGSISQSVAPQHNDPDQFRLDCPAGITHQEAAQDEEIVIPRVYYFAAWTDSGCLLGCRHHHTTVISAVACISEAGGYVIAVEKGNLRALNDSEEETFLVAAYGMHAASKRLANFEPMRVLKPSLN